MLTDREGSEKSVEKGLAFQLALYFSPPYSGLWTLALVLRDKHLPWPA